MLGSKLDLHDNTTKELRTIISQLVEAREWFAKVGKIEETSRCDRAMQAIVKAVFLADKASACTLQNRINNISLPELLVN